MKHLGMIGKILYHLGAIKLHGNYPKIRLLHPLGLVAFIIQFVFDFIKGGIEGVSKLKQIFFVWW